MTRFERKIVLIFLVTGLVPLAAALYFAAELVDDSFRVGVNQRVLGRFERSLVYHRELIESWKRAMDLETEGIASSAAVAVALESEDRAPLGALLAEHTPPVAPEDLARPALIRLVVRDSERREIASVEAKNAPPERTHRLREVRRPLPGGGEIAATFATPETAIQEFRSAAETTRTFRHIESMRDDLEQRYYLVFLAILVAVLLLSFALGLALARRVTHRIAVLHEATEAVGAGDLTVRVPVGPKDEIGELTSAFNRMVQELGENRERIAYLSKISVWQDVARRLAHEIKNPLQPIQLAMQELHRRYPAPAREASQGEYKGVLDSTLEIVEEELNTLRRLTTEFSTFARLPEVKLEPEDLHGLLRDCAATPVPPGDVPVSVDWRVPAEPCIVSMDRMLLRRVFDNLVRNAIEAVRVVRSDGTGRVVVSVESDPGRRRVHVRIADNGPGVPAEARDRLFDPYYTTKADGTGLGLAIVKKVVLDHGGVIGVASSKEGGAEFAISLPLRGASAS